ncbi:hypothetical protein BDV59DRAFT_120884 [Aspergillus ambiguus]|uniref:uncharacterized protein n=1 Tax=Aspergillus ambiguus TaxID=176160 RepID=UPI003CCD3CE9
MNISKNRPAHNFDKQERESATRLHYKRACASCRAKKIKCSGRPCSNCDLYGIACSLVDSSVLETPDLPADQTQPLRTGRCARACDNCYKGKTKCSGFPCLRCIGKEMICEFRRPMRKKGRRWKSGLPYISSSAYPPSGNTGITGISSDSPYPDRVVTSMDDSIFLPPSFSPQSHHYGLESIPRQPICRSGHGGALPPSTCPLDNLLVPHLSIGIFSGSNVGYWAAYESYPHVSGEHSTSFYFN